MTSEHDRIQELVAGHALRSLSGDDAREADRLLAEHVPTCPACRALLRDHEALAGDLALGADPREPPDLLLARLHREMGAPGRRRRPVAVAAAAASFVAVMGFAGLAVSQGVRAANADERSALMSEALRFASRPDASAVELSAPSGAAAAPVTEITAPGVEVIYLVCHDVDPPEPGMIYRVWLRSGETFRYVTEFEPDPAGTVLRVRFDPAAVDEVLITEEPADRAPGQPETGAIRWSDAA